MKKIKITILFLFLSLCLVAQNAISFSGKVENMVDDKLSIEGASFYQVICLKGDGTFAEKLQIPYQGAYTLKNTNESIPIYLIQNSSLNITVDGNDYLNSVVFTGNGKYENDYLQEKSRILKKLNDKLKDRKNDLLQISYENIFTTKPLLTENLKNSKNLDSTFIKMENRNLNYNIESLKANYIQLKKIIPSTSNSHSKILRDSIYLDSVDIDNEEDFLFSNAYRSLLGIYVKNRVEKLNIDDEKYTAKYYLSEIKNIKSPHIINYFSEIISKDINADNPQFEEIYNTLMTISTNERFKKNNTTKYLKLKNLLPGSNCPSFDYENFKGGKTSLESLKGKYIYLNVWTTWCNNCLYELPYFEKILQKYATKNIAFVSISIDKKSEYLDWRRIVTNKKLKGIHLFADDDYQSKFVRNIELDKTLKFLIIDPEGKIVTSDALFPSDPKLIEKLDGLLNNVSK